MDRHWKPESRVTITDAGVIIEVKLGKVQGMVIRPGEGNQLRIGGHRDDIGWIETSVEVPAGYNLANARMTLVKGILRIEVPPDKGGSPLKPCSMLIYCKGCGKHFDIEITAKGPHDYRCPVCGMVQTFDLDDLVKKAIEQGRKMLRRKGGRR